MQKQFEAFFFGEVKILLKNVEFLLIEKFEFIVDYIFGRAEEFACLFVVEAELFDLCNKIEDILLRHFDKEVA